MHLPNPAASNAFADTAFLFYRKALPTLQKAQLPQSTPVERSHLQHRSTPYHRPVPKRAFSRERPRKCGTISGVLTNILIEERPLVLDPLVQRLLIDVVVWGACLFNPGPQARNPDSVPRISMICLVRLERHPSLMIRQ